MEDEFDVTEFGCYVHMSVACTIIVAAWFLMLTMVF